MKNRDDRLRFTGAWLLLAIGTSLSTVAHAGTGVWTSGGPYGGYTRALAIDPLNPATLYAGTSGGVFKSTNSGGTWVRTGLRKLSVFALAINSATPATLYAGTEDGVFRSTNSGGTWVHTGLTKLSVFALAINPATPSTLFAATNGDGVFKSTDSGGTWAAANTGLTSLRASALAIDPATPTTLFAGTEFGVFKSTNSGGTWAAPSTGVTFWYIQALAINPATPSTLYAGTYGGSVFKSTNSGATWTGAGPNATVYALAIDPATPATLYAGTYRGVFKSTDSGGTWAAANTGLQYSEVHALAINPSTPATLYAGAWGGGVFKSTDSGGTWAAANTGLSNLDVWGVRALAINPSTPGTLYAGTGGVFKSTDSGGTWAATGLTSGGVTALATDPATPATLYAGTVTGVFKSTDSGGTWADVSMGLPSWGGYEDVYVVSALAINSVTPATLYAGTFAYGVFKSTDSGGTWVAASTGLTSWDVNALAIDPTTPATLYAGAGGGVFKSTNAGGTWVAANTGLSSLGVSALAINPSTPSTLYAGTFSGGVFKSTDAGATWSAAGLASQSVVALAIDPATPATLYAGTYRGGVFKSTDSGGTWVAMNAGLPNLSVNALALDPTGATTLYAGLQGGGVWQLTPLTGEPTSSSGFVPIVLDVTGYAHYTSELQLTNLGASPTTVKLSYTSSIGSGSGDVLETIPAGQQVVYPDAISHLRSEGVLIPTSGNQGGTLLLSAPAAGIHATVRTSADTVDPQPLGRGGLAYSDTDPAASSAAMKLYIYGLRTNDADRSNLAVYNMGADPVSLKVILVSGDDGSSFEVTAGVPRVLPAYGWYQYGDGLLLRAAGFSSGYAIVERVNGSGPFGAYGVVNDQVTNDGSFIPALPGTQSGSKLTVPVLVETGTFKSELILANRGSATATLTLRYFESLSPAKGPGGATTVDVAAGRQRIIPNAIDFLRSKGVGVGARGEAGYAGSLQIRVSGVGLENVFAGARTSSLPAAGFEVYGKFGAFYPAVGSSQEFSDLAFVLGLKSDTDNRSNVAAIHTGTDGSGPITLEFQVLDGSEGGKAVGQPLSVILNPGDWVQPSRFFASGNVPNGYVRIRRTAGTAPWYAYGVINDGSQPGRRTDDGAYVPGVRP